MADAQEVLARLKADPELQIGMLTADEIHALRTDPSIPTFTATMERPSECRRKPTRTDLEDVTEERLLRKIAKLRQLGWRRV